MSTLLVGGKSGTQKKGNATRRMVLKNIYYKLEEKHQAGLPELLEELETEGICPEAVDDGTGSVTWSNSDGALLITDYGQLAEQAGEKGIACIGISESDRYFAGAALVLPDLQDVDVQMLRECFCHFQGIPATIAESSRLILKEIAEEDVEMLCQIGAEEGMEYAFCGSRKKAGFMPAVLRAYCKEQYRLYGYGLWGVFLKEDACSQEAVGNGQESGKQARLVGCCGFAEASEISARLQKNMADESPCVSDLAKDYADGWRTGQEVPGQCTIMAPEWTEHGPGHGLALELEYMLSIPYRCRGIGNEMCRMALQYAREYLRVETVWVQVHEKNVAGYALARKLGFRPADDRGKSPC